MTNPGYLSSSHRPLARPSYASSMAEPGRSRRRAGDVATAVAERRFRSARARRRRRQLGLWALVGVLVGAGSFGAGLLAAPLDYDFQPLPPQAVLLLDHEGRVFATIRAPQDQEPVRSEQIPAVMKEAIVAAEDERFFEHSGVDPLAVVRALWRDVTGANLQGGSTITQQYVKNVYTGSERTALRKMREASLAVRLEQHLSKDQILTRYLNTLYLGNGTAGVQAASRYYYGVPIEDLDLDRRTGERDQTLALARAATLAGFVPAPSAWNPVADPEQARSRQIYVLNRMISSGVITSQEASDAAADGLPRIVAQSQPDAPTVAPEFRDYVAEQLKGTLAFTDTTLFNSGGVKVRTTLDLDLEKAAVHALRTVLPGKSGPEAAVVAVDPRNGDIRALTTKTTGRGYQKGGFDLARDARRSTGSTIKPFTLALALQKGHTLDEPHSAPQCVDSPYHVCNAESGSSYQTLRTALVHSINTVYGPLAVELGLRNVVDLMRDAGMRVDPLVKGSDGKPFPAQALGVQVSPLDEAVGYSTLVNHGIQHGPRSVLRVRSAGSGVLFEARENPAGDRAIPRGVADQVTEAMQGVVDAGTATAARQPFPVYGKTGTTDDFTNAWFTGCTRTLCISVWMGYNKPYLQHGRVPHSMVNVAGQPGGVYGGTLPARIFAETWEGFRTLQESPGSLDVSPTPSPADVVPQPQPQTTTSAPKPTKEPRPKPTKTQSEEPSSSPSPTPTDSGLLPTPVAVESGRSSRQAARRDRVST
jgi:membrane peptidoglycan carboxypeptidase